MVGGRYEDGERPARRPRHELRQRRRSPGPGDLLVHGEGELQEADGLELPGAAQRSGVDRPSEPQATLRRATTTQLTAAGWDAVVEAAPGHVETVRHTVIDPLTPEHLEQLRGTGDALLTRLDPDRRLTFFYVPGGTATDTDHAEA